nr:DUF1345 domain-containing protein [Pseudopedobacter sp.]
MKYLKHINRLNAHHRLYISLISATVVASYFFVFIQKFNESSFLITWLAYSISHLFLSWITILSIHPIEVKKLAPSQDSNRTFIFIFVISACLIGLFSIVLMLSTIKELKGRQFAEYLILSISSVISAWWMLHTVFTFRYAHLYYLKNPKVKGSYKMGLSFPDEKEPDYLDFAYFSFVLGMTFQVSDVEIGDRILRRSALLHGLISFVFNTVIIALTISIVSNLIN